jgi:hypothetical protein
MTDILDRARAIADDVLFPAVGEVDRQGGSRHEMRARYLDGT